MSDYQESLSESKILSVLGAYLQKIIEQEEKIIKKQGKIIELIEKHNQKVLSNDNR